MTYTPAVPVESQTYRHYALNTVEIGLPLASGTGAASLTWPLANLAIYVPLYINETLIVYEAGVGAGATAGGNYDIGIYDAAGTRLVSSGTTARTASAWNTAGLTDTTLTPGWYYVGMSADGTNNYSGNNPAAGLCESVGICEQTTAFTLPATATLTRTTRAYVPAIALATRSVAL